VVIPVATEHYTMFVRNLVYMGVIRGKRPISLSCKASRLLPGTRTPDAATRSLDNGDVGRHNRPLTFSKADSSRLRIGKPSQLLGGTPRFFVRSRNLWCCSMMSVAHHLVRLQLRVEAIAENHSVPGKSGLDLDETLSGLDLVGRRRVKMILERIRAFSNDPDEKAAADHIQMRAARAWYGPSVSFVSLEETAPTKSRRRVVALSESRGLRARTGTP
jgi:hypothetical protein